MVCCRAVNCWTGTRANPRGPNSLRRGWTVWICEGGGWGGGCVCVERKWREASPLTVCISDGTLPSVVILLPIFILQIVFFRNSEGSLQPQQKKWVIWCNSESQPETVQGGKKTTARERQQVQTHRTWTSGAPVRNKIRQILQFLCFRILIQALGRFTKTLPLRFLFQSWPSRFVHENKPHVLVLKKIKCAVRQQEHIFINWCNRIKVYNCSFCYNYGFIVFGNNLNVLTLIFKVMRSASFSHLQSDKMLNSTWLYCCNLLSTLN